MDSRRWRDQIVPWGRLRSLASHQTVPRRWFCRGSMAMSSTRWTCCAYGTKEKDHPATRVTSDNQGRIRPPLFDPCIQRLSVFVTVPPFREGQQLFVYHRCADVVQFALVVSACLYSVRPSPVVEGESTPKEAARHTTETFCLHGQSDDNKGTRPRTVSRGALSRLSASLTSPCLPNILSTVFSPRSTRVTPSSLAYAQTVKPFTGREVPLSKQIASVGLLAHHHHSQEERDIEPDKVKAPAAGPVPYHAMPRTHRRITSLGDRAAEW